jgi:hypothetical protein
MLSPGIFLTLGATATGWQFVSWARHNGTAIMVRPTETDAKRTFATIGNAARYFRDRYERTIELEASARSEARRRPG